MNAMEVLCQRYCQYLSEVRGFAAATVQQHLSTSQDSLSRGLPDGAELAGLTAADVESYVQIKSKEVSRQTLQHVVGHLRAFLRYCADHAQTKRGLDCIDTPRTYRGELPPRALDWELVRRLLVSVDRKSRNGWRDHAILHLMAYYGLRPSEIVSLNLSSIDWDAQTIRVEQCKTQSILVLPLAPRTLRMLRLHFRIPRQFKVAAKYVPMTSVAGDLYDFLGADDKHAGLIHRRCFGARSSGCADRLDGEDGRHFAKRPGGSSCSSAGGNEFCALRQYAGAICNRCLRVSGCAGAGVALLRQPDIRPCCC